jgi:hypothetical protein
MTDVIAQYPAVIDRTIQIYRGDATVPYRLSITVGAGGTRLPLDGFGDTWTCQLRTSPDGPLAATFTVDSSDAATGWIVLNSLTGVTTAALKAGETYGADVQATGGDVSPITVWRLAFYVQGDYTQ